MHLHPRTFAIPLTWSGGSPRTFRAWSRPRAQSLARQLRVVSPYYSVVSNSSFMLEEYLYSIGGLLLLLQLQLLLLFGVSCRRFYIFFFNMYSVCWFTHWPPTHTWIEFNSPNSSGVPHTRIISTNYCSHIALQLDHRRYRIFNSQRIHSVEGYCCHPLWLRCNSDW